MYLLDTNALIILLFGKVTTAELSKETLDILEGSDEIYASEASLWEMAIKMKIGKLYINESVYNIAEKCRQEGVRFIPMTIGQIDKTLDLPLLPDHREPFDRLIIAVAKTNGLSLISTDEKMYDHQGDYGIKVIS